MDKNEYKKSVVLLSTHILNEYVIQKYRKLYCDLDKEKYDIILLLNVDDGCEWSIPNDIICFTTNCESLNALLYEPIEETLLPGSCHFPLLRFYIDNPDYRFYWFIEYDVEFTGNWSSFMNDCSANLSDYDFLSCHIERFDENKNKYWAWWHRSNNVGYTLTDCIKGFNPICRYSNAALSYLDHYQKKGYSAHSEVMITTCLYHGGFRIGDFGGRGEFVPEGYENRYYIPNMSGINDGTMRYRPLYTLKEIEGTGLRNKLFHPLKEINNRQDCSVMSVNKTASGGHENCVVFITHKIDSLMLHYLSYLKKETENIMDFVILYDNSSQILIPEEYPDFQFCVFNSDKLDGFFHYGERRLPNPLVALVDFSKKFEYKHYLLMENDIVFTGDMAEFIQNIDAVDTDYIHIATDILGGPNNHWPINYIRNNPFKKLYFSWCQLFYISHRYLTDLDTFMKGNNSFYYEFLLPTMAYNNGYSVMQFENLGYQFQLSWGPVEIYEYKYQYERMYNTFYHPIKNLDIVDK